MVDKNGHVMFHPQLKPIDRVTRQVKPNYNNMDFLELEVPQNQKQARRAIINCDNTETFSMDILYANLDLGRVYRQTNDYYSECIRRAHFSIGMAVAKDDEVRLRRKMPKDRQVKANKEWFSGKRWRIHPKWRYCLLNDTDTGLTAEEAFFVYVKQMHEVPILPDLCRSRKALVERVLLDGEATNDIENFWDLNWEQHKEKGIHLVFFATTSGFIKFHNQTLDNYLYEDPNYLEPSLLDEITNDPRHRVKKPVVAPEINKYEHFVLELNRKSMADPYFKRAVRMPNTIVFDVNSRTKLWYGKSMPNGYGNEENETLLVTATQALYLDQALVGVVGMEFVYDHLVNTMASIGCGPSDEQMWCFLIDEHAYVVYSSLNTTTYSAYFAQNEKAKRDNVIGKWFGHVNRVTERTMELLLKKNFYTVTTYVDYQAMCKNEQVAQTTASASRLTFSILKFIGWFVHQLFRLITQTLPSLFWLDHFSVPAKAYTVSFQSNTDEYPCDKMSKFYIANTKARTEAFLIDENHYERPCGGSCAVKLYASWVPHTNLLLVGILQGSGSWCYDETQCPRGGSSTSGVNVPFGFGFIKVGSDQKLSIDPTDPASDSGPDGVSAHCRHLVPPKLGAGASQCLKEEDEDGIIPDESEFPCSPADSVSPFKFLIFCVVIGQMLRL
ncbi:hypothetical protein L596_004560 [Steinernema carpocapsae]|uniref:Voltage-dependent calcium channel alpha-2/delta subunit conserved region domain-containing protein n=1 Tax=Steinernema carpocapsae TaxID=34508 RepID=A0A4U8UWA9_STECR|nr:hypothetical protein L596_004560 [Steinernema carpocapsae]